MTALSEDYQDFYKAIWNYKLIKIVKMGFSLKQMKEGNICILYTTVRNIS